MTQYNRRNWKKIPKNIEAILESAKDFGFGGYCRDPSHEEIAASLRKHQETPFSIIILSEYLDESHEDNKDYVTKEEVELVSELEESWIRLLWRNNKITEEIINYEQANKTDRDTAIEAVKQKHLPGLLERIKEDYQEFGEIFDEKKIRQTRTEIRTQRIYHLPKPFSGRELSQQYYLIPDEKKIIWGSSSSSGLRENHSRYGFAFALLNRYREVPTHLLVYDRHNQLKFVNSFVRLCLVRYDLGSNYHLGIEEQKKILQNTYLLYSNPRKMSVWIEKGLK